MGLHGIPATSISVAHSAAPFGARISVMIGSSSARLVTRSGLRAKRGSSINSGCPTSSQNFAQWLSNAIATTKKPSPVG